MILSARDFVWDHLGVVSVSYAPKNIHTEAIQVTAENIGALSLEMEAELRYNGKDPVIVFKAERGTVEDPPQEPVVINLWIGDWLIVLWDELRVFKDYEFKNTFSPTNKGPHHELTEFEKLEARAEDVLRHYEPTISGNLGNETLPAEQL